MCVGVGVHASVLFQVPECMLEQFYMYVQTYLLHIHVHLCMHACTRLSIYNTAVAGPTPYILNPKPLNPNTILGPKEGTLFRNCKLHDSMAVQTTEAGGAS